VKTCSTCGETKNESEFYKNGKRLSSECKTCNKARVRRYQQEHKEAYKTYLKNYNETHIEELRAKRHEYNLEHREEKHAYNRKWKEYRRDLKRASSRRYYLKHRDHILRRTMNYVRCHPEVRRASQLRRYARIAKGMVTAQDLLEVAEACKWSCTYCGRVLDYAEVTYDHIVPLSRGGRHIKENLTLACGSCNSSKGMKTVEEWRMSK
jgi:5-methylcytosine-specific restriction endonuclease McrA